MAKSFTFRFIGDASSFKKATKDAGDSVDVMAGRFDGAIKGIGNKFAGLGTLAVAGVGMAADKLVQFGQDSVMMASDAGEAVNKVKVVFGDAADEMLAFSSTAATSLGMSAAEANSATGLFGNMFVQLGVGSDRAAELSKGMVTLAADLGSFHNADPTDVLNSMSGAFRGEYDAVQKFIPSISDAAVKTKALEMTGKDAEKSLTEQEKALAAYTIMMQTAGPALGDWARTQDSAANSMKTFTKQFEDAKAQFGEALLPLLTAAMTAATPLIQNLTKILEPLVPVVTPIIGLLTDMAVTLGNALTPVLAAIGPPLAQMIEAFRPLAGEIGQLFVQTMTTLAPVFAKLLEALVPVAQKLTDALVPVIRDQIIPNLPKMQDAMLKVVDAVIVLLDEVTPLIPTLADMLAKMAPEVIDNFAAAMLALAEALKILEPTLQSTTSLMNMIPSGLIGALVNPGGYIGDKIEGRAVGGPVHGGTPYLVGERGPELFRPKSSGEIIPNGRMSAQAAPVGPTTVILQVDRFELGRVVVDQMRREAYAGVG